MQKSTETIPRCTNPACKKLNFTTTDGGRCEYCGAIVKNEEVGIIASCPRDRKAGEEHFFSASDKICRSCGSTLLKEAV